PDSSAPVPVIETSAAASIPETPAVPAAPASHPSFTQFVRLGVEHILTSFDHLLFLAALLIGVRKPAALLGIITCFTVAHSLTLALAALNIAVISPRIIEPLIAFSIILAGVENILRPNAVGERFFLAGGFGLIHGFGFAGALRETGLGQAGAS